MLLDKEQAVLLVIDVQEKLLPAIQDADRLQSRLAWLIGVCRDGGLPIVFSEQYPRGLGHTIPALRALAPDAPAVEKVHFCCVAAGCLPEWTLSQQQFVLCGMESHVCVLQTAEGLLRLGKTVFVVADAIGSRRALDHQLALERLRQAGAHIVSREMVLFETLRQAGTAAFKAASVAWLQGDQPD
ncbi:hydrolase [Paludibacterium purpuratum]|uniref:Nicotinamidase-related amidase n=1 Tax=Paludibacterium purpuratum TaxID=1144873 RepID=A0A4R7BC08_9NEIS|nr:hydrolase [Paludibacterium purpuratum]TDR81435.1 nicotinamidase-related amidase [Paludibacterium purpuratum]